VVIILRALAIDYTYKLSCTISITKNGTSDAVDILGQSFVVKKENCPERAIDNASIDLVGSI
tara:strand:- start:263 stop:448 length:186 start_codon:yes stop_codon:yes gene_type:complete